MHEMLCTNKKKTNSSFALICFQTKIFIDKLQNTELVQPTRQTATPCISIISFPSVPSTAIILQFQQLKIHDCIDSIERKRKYA